jgi:hypothetical protein
MRYILVLLIILGIAIPTGVGIVNANKIPTFDIVSVVPDEVVTIETSDFPEDMTFDVLIGRYGNFGKDGIKVATQDSGKGGAFTATFNLPKELKGVEKLSIRLENKTTGYYSYNWFENAVMEAKDKTATAVPASGEEVVYHPSFTITKVDMDKSITVSGTGFPVDQEFDVLMGEYGSTGMGGVKVFSQKTGPKGDFNATYTIPAVFQGGYKVAIRMESAKSAYYAYNYFYNASFPPAEAPAVVEATKAETPAAATEDGVVTYEGYPSFTVTSVKKDVSVAIQAENLPPNETFEIYLTDYDDGSAEVVKAGTMETKDGGTATATFSIPSEIQGLNQISVRLSGMKTGYFAYNFFFNADFPVDEAARAAASSETPAPTPAPTAVP